MLDSLRYSGLVWIGESLWNDLKCDDSFKCNLYVVLFVLVSRRKCSAMESSSFSIMFHQFTSEVVYS